MRGPSVFLFDEPLSKLDAELRIDMRVEIARLHKQIGANMIYVTHDQVEAMTLADKIAVLRHGHIEQIGPPMELYQNPSKKFVAGFIWSPSMNFLEGIVQNKSVVIPALDNIACQPSVNLPARGTKVMVGYRPQDIDLFQAASSLSIDIKGQLRGISYLYMNALTGERLVAEIKDKDLATLPNEISVAFDNSNLNVFDVKTE